MLNKNVIDKKYTHMPFLYPCHTHGSVLFMCTCEDAKTWKLHYSINNSKLVRLNTQLPGHIIECAPTAWYDKKGWHISFIAGHPNGDHRTYYLYMLEGKSFKTLSTPKPIKLARTGFIHKNKIVYGEIANTIHLDYTDNKPKDIYIPGAYLYRLSYMPDNTDKLIISGGWIDKELGNVFTLTYDLNTKEQEFIICDGKPAYKCAMLGDQLLYTYRISKDHFEHRKIKEANKITRESTTHCKLINLDARDDWSNKQLIATQKLQEHLTVCTTCEAYNDNVCGITETAITHIKECPISKW